jgi:hypothetical protein
VRFGISSEPRRRRRIFPVEIYLVVNSVEHRARRLSHDRAARPNRLGRRLSPGDPGGADQDMAMAQVVFI